MLTFFFALPAGAANIADTLAENENFSTLNSAVGATDLGETLANGENLTVFAPNNDAFERLPEGFSDYLVANPDLLTDLLNYHVATELLEAEDIARLTEVPTANGQVIPLKAVENELFLSNAKVVESTDADNGVIHEIDRVLFPPLLFDEEPPEDDTADEEDGGEEGDDEEPTDEDTEEGGDEDTEEEA